MWGIQCGYEDYSVTKFSVNGYLPASPRDSNIAFIFDPRSARSPGPKKSSPRSQTPIEGKLKLSLRDDFHDSFSLSTNPQLIPNCEMAVTSLDSIYLTVQDPQHHESELLRYYYIGTPWPAMPVWGRYDFWRRIFPSSAQSSQYVLHTLQCFSALHLALVRPENRCKYQRLSMVLYHKAITVFREQVHTLGDENRDAVLSFMSLMVVIELGFMNPSCEPHYADGDPIDKLLQRFSLIQKSLCMLRLPELQGSRVYSLIQDAIHSLGPKSIASEMSPALQFIENLNLKITVSAKEQQIYSQTIRELHISSYLATNQPSEWIISLRWVLCMSPQYHSLLDARHPMALLILANYCLLIRQLKMEWFMQSWSERVLIAVHNLLDKEWQAYLSWVM